MDERLTRELDETTAHALALMTLYASARYEDDRRTRGLLAEYLAEEDGIGRTVGGLESLCAVLLAIIEFETGVPVERTLQRIGVMTAATRLSTEG
jgi:hypothetical protein